MDAKLNPDGTLTHNIYEVDENKREFKDEETFYKWIKKHLKDRREYLKTQITPY